MKIGMLLNAPYPSDLRVKKEASALIDAGFSIYLLCLRRNDEKYEDEVDGINITRIDAGKSNFELAFWDILMSATTLHPRFKASIREWVTKNSLQLLHIHDLPLVGTALSLKGTLNLPVIADFHENYPEALKAWFEWKKNPIARLKNYLFMNPLRWTKIERHAVLKSDHVIAVVDEMKNRLVKDYNAPANKITIVTNTEEHDFVNQKEDPEVYAAYSGKFIVTYSGNIGPHRGVDTVIEAMQYLKEYPIVLVIVGSGNTQVMTNLKQMSEALGVKQNVHFLGRQPFSKFYSFMKFANVNVIPHKSNGHTDNTVPHKLFQAMMVGKPVLVSSSAPLKRIITETMAGVIFKASDSKDCSQKILELFNDEQLRNKLGNNGINATLKGNMNWEHTKETLVDLYRSLIQQ